MDKKTLISVFFMTSLLAQAYSQWEVLNTFEQKAIQKLNFISDDLGYAMANDLTVNKKIIIKTKDGGSSWDTIPNVSYGEFSEFMDICFIKDSVGFSVFRDFNNSSAPMRIHKTFDDGLNWEDITPETTNIGMGHSVVQFLDENIGFWGVAHMLYKTNDGGNTWDTTILNNVSVMSLDFINADTGVIGTWDNSFFYSGSMYSTFDGGNSFDIYNLNLYSSVIHEINFMNNNTVYATCTDNLFWGGRKPFICKSTDGGNSWDSIAIDTFGIEQVSLSAIDFIDDLSGKIVLKTPFSDTGYVFGTSNGALSWEFEDTVYLRDVTDLQIMVNTAYVTGDENELYKTSSPLETYNFSNHKSHLSLYPNPIHSNSILTISTKSSYSSVDIFDILGQHLYKLKVNNNNIQLPQLKQGLYCLKLSNSLGNTSSYILVN
tara:strand:+ start:7484 stop:8776 length:1293 start_codon:yes stop_codon:yes gene_type:complete